MARTGKATGSQPAKGPGGRPTKYDPAYCEDIVAFCGQGYSITAFAGSIGVARSTIQEWADANPEFSVAVRAAKAASAFWWESRSRRVAERGGGPGTATVIVFNLKNMAPDDYREKVDHSLAGPDGGPVKTDNTFRLVFVEGDNPDADDRDSEGV